MQSLPEFKAADLTRHASKLFDAATCSPVAITKHDKPKFVLMSIDKYHAFVGQTRQQAHMIEELPQDLKAMMIEGLEKDLEQDDA